MQLHQHTLKEPVSCTGIGLHSGRRINMTLRPAEPNTGVMFKRTDMAGAPLVPGDVHHVVDTTLCTTVGYDGVFISTVEHLLSALSGLGVDNCLVEVDGSELPIMDGSAAPFAFLIKNAGLADQPEPRAYFRVTREVSVTDGDKTATVLPDDEFSVAFTIDYDHPQIKRQTLDYAHNQRAYDRDISRARTFGFLKDIRAMHSVNLALGGSLDNAVVLDDYQVLNDDGLRFGDEFVRHKVLDFIGDVALVGRPVLGRFVAHKSGHALNNKLFRKLLADPQACQLVTPANTPAGAEPAVKVAYLSQAVA